MYYMNIRFLLFGITLLITTPTIALGASDDSCAESVYLRLGQEERLYRSVLFGLSTAEDMPINGVLLDTDGDTWMKTAENEWKSIENPGLTWTNTVMENRRDVPARRGILEVQKALSSELLPSVLQAMRATHCRMEAVCATALSSENANEGVPTVTVQPDGCIEFEMPVMNACRVSDLTSFNQGGCSEQVQRIVEREQKMLELLFAYDASYRTLMQFAGTFEGFLSDFRFPLLQPLWQMVRTLGQLDNLPCFLAECNE